MKCKEFIEHVQQDLIGFQKNMDILKEDDNLLHEWMDMFLRWSEWQTDMHVPYWIEGWEDE